MMRRDAGVDADRPHYYSQFWIDVAAGRREIGAGQRTAQHEREPEPEEAFDLAALELPEVVAQDEAQDEAQELAEPEPPEVTPAKAARPTKAKPESRRPEPARPALTSLADLAKIDLMMKSSAEMDSDTVPDVERAVRAAPDAQDAIVTDFDADTFAPEEEPVAAAEDEDFEPEFEDEDEWGEEEGPRRGSKPNKRQRREPRRDF